MNKRDPRQLEREKLLFRYSSALQRGDFAAVESVLLEAQHDPALDDQIADLNAAYETELNAAHTILSNKRPYREDQPVNVTLNRTVKPFPGTRRMPFTLAAAVLAVALISVVVLALRSGGSKPNNLAAIEQSLSPTATASATVTPSPVVESALNVVGCGSDEAMIFSPTNGQVITNPISITGKASSDNFSFYRFELLGPSTFGEFAAIQDGSQAVPQGGELGQLNPSSYEAGAYQLRLSVFDVSNSLRASCLVNIVLAGPTATATITASPSLTPSVTATWTPNAIAPAGNIAAPAALCQVMVPANVYVYWRPFPDDAGGSSKFTEDTVVDVLDQYYNPSNTYSLWYFIGLPNDTTPKFQGWVRADQITPISPCPEPANVPQVAASNVDGILLTATYIVDQATAMAQPSATLQVDARLSTQEAQSADALLQLCETAVEAGQLDMAQSTCQQATSLKPDSAEAYHQLGVVNYQKRNYEIAVENFQRCADLGSQEFDCQYLRGLAYFYLGQCDAAWNILSDLYTRTQNLPDSAEAVQQIQAGLAAIIQNCDGYRDRTLPTPISPVAALSVPLAMPTVCPPMPIPTLIADIPVSTRDALALRVTAVVAQAGVLAQQPCSAVPAQAVAIPSLVATPTSALIDSTMAVLLVNAGTIPAGTTVQLISASFNGTEWDYEVSTLDHTASAVVPESQLAPAMSLATATPIPAAIAIPSSTQPLTGVIASQEAVAVRQGPDFSYPLILKVVSGNVVTIIEGTGDGLWYKVRLVNDLVGWIPANVVNLALPSIAMPLPTTIPPPSCVSNQVMNITSHLLEIVSDPSDKGVTIGTLTPGAIATVMSSNVQSDFGTWTQISIAITGSSITGWVPMNAVTSLPCAAAGTATDAPLETSPVCAVFNSNNTVLGVKNAPSSSALSIGVLPVSIVADVQGQVRSDEDGHLWYFVSAQIDSASIAGWVREDMVTPLDSCSNDPNAVMTVLPTVEPAASFTPIATATATVVSP